MEGQGVVNDDLLKLQQLLFEINSICLASKNGGADFMTIAIKANNSSFNKLCDDIVAKFISNTQEAKVAEKLVRNLKKVREDCNSSIEAKDYVLRYVDDLMANKAIKSYANEVFN